MQYKAFPAEFKADEEGRSFTGYAATFGNIDAGRDRVARGAFTKTIAERGNRVKVLWQHSRNNPIGVPKEMQEDDAGLLVAARVSDTTLGRDVMVLMKDGVVDQLSIGYDVIKDHWDREESVRNLLELRLFEFSPVTFPMNELAMITDVKHMSIADLEYLAERAVFLAEHGLKTGRVLSKRNLERVRDAYDALGTLLTAAKDDGSEPDEESTPNDDQKQHADAKEPEPSTQRRVGDEDPFAGLVTGIKDLGGWAQHRRLVEDLRSFGQSLRTGERS